MKQKLKEEIAEKTRDALLDEQIEDLARESVKEKTITKAIDFSPKNPNENIFSSIISLQRLVTGVPCGNCGEPRLEIEVPDTRKNIFQRVITKKKIDNILAKKKK